MAGVILGTYWGLPFDIFSVYFIGDLEHRGSRRYFETQSDESELCGDCCLDCECDNVENDCQVCEYTTCVKCEYNFDTIDQCDLNYCPKCGTPVALPIQTTIECAL